MIGILQARILEVSQLIPALTLLAVLFIVSSPLSAAEVTNGRRLTLLQAANEALDHNPELKSAVEAVTEARANRRFSLSPLLPQIAGNLSATRKKDAVDLGGAKFDGNAYSSYLAQLTLNQPLLYWGILSGLSSAKQQILIQGVNYEITKRQLYQDILGAFYQVLLNQSKLSILNKTKTVYQDLLKISEYRNKIGRAQLLDVLQSKTQLALLEPQIEQASNDLEVSAMQLARYLGDEQTSKLEVVGQLNAPEWKTVEEKLKSLDVRLLDLEKVKFEQAQLESEKNAVQGKYWPNLSANGNWGRSTNNAGDLSDGYSTQWAVGLQLTVPLFSGMGGIFETQVYRSKIEQLNLQERSVREQIALDQIKTARSLDSAVSVLNTSATAVTLANSAMTEARREYKLSTIDSPALLTAEQNQLNAQLNYEQGKYDYVRALGAYFSAKGFSLDILVDILATAKGEGS